MKHLLHILLLLLIFRTTVFAQAFLPDYQTYSEIDIVGTARYVAMGGAFTALGGDVSAALHNPAALGVFRHGEVSLTTDVYFDKVSSGINTDNAFRFSVPQTAWVMNFNHSDGQKGLLKSSLMLQYHRLKTYTRNSFYSAAGQSLSLTDLMVDMTNGLEESALEDSYWYNNRDVGTLSEAAYQLFLIDPDEDNPYYWHSILNADERVDNILQINESGSADEYSFSWGGNISNCVYFGLGANLRSINYHRTATFREDFEQGGSFSLTSAISTSGIGFDATVGIIAYPTNHLRIGVSYQTPVWMALGTYCYTDAWSKSYNNGSFSYKTPRITDDYFVLPMRLSTGLAFQFGIGAVSLQYDWQHHTDNIIPDMHNLRVGTEFVIKNNLFLRAGYATMSSFRKTDLYFSPAIDDIRSDTDYKNLHIAHFVSAGLGFRNKYIIAEMAYQCRMEKARQYAFSRPLNDYEGYATDYQNMSYDMNAVTHRIVFTIAWTMRR